MCLFTATVNISFIYQSVYLSIYRLGLGWYLTASTKPFVKEITLICLRGG